MRGTLATCLLVLLLAACEEPAPDAQSPPAPTVPKLGSFNEHVLAIQKTYPTDGTHRYHWPRSGAWIGITRDLRYDGTLFASGDADGRCHCSGLTFEVFLRAWERWCRAQERPYRILGWTKDDLGRFQRAWFGTTGDRATLHTALTESGLGVRITDLEKAKPGDFVQLWRHSGSGHSCLFQAWIRAPDGTIQGLRYWSTQSSTNGIGERGERFGTSGSALKRDEFYVVRVGR